MRVIIAGSRPSKLLSPAALARWQLSASRAIAIAVEASGFVLTEVVCGMAPGIDSLGREYANARGIPVHEMPADFGRFGRAAGPIRNKEMGRYADALIAVTEGTRGTAQMIAFMRSLEKPVHVHKL